jgi:uracil-DNA glycosylase family 4
MDDQQLAQAAARQLLAQHLESLERSGVMQIGKVPLAKLRPVVGVNPPTAAATGTPPARQANSPIPTPPPAQDAPMPRAKPAPALAGMSLITQPYPTDIPSDTASRQQLLDQLNEQVKPCQLCSVLAKQRTQTVFGVGNPAARVAFFGEAPGADEDRQGEPFVGRAGQLLTKIIEACTWKRSDVYILNVLKCRPPENRNPDPDETTNCRPFFERQFEILQPEYIVCVGTIPAQALLETAESVGKLRGRFHRYRGSKVLVTYHPSYLLRNPAAKKYVWEDMQLLLKEMGIPIPSRGS